MTARQIAALVLVFGVLYGLGVVLAMLGFD
jgi:hypothetical protein